MINIKGLNKAEVLLELYNHSKEQRLGVITPDIELSVEDCEALLEDHISFDFLFDRIIKVDLSDDDEFDESLYDKNNGKGKAQEAIDDLRKKHVKRLVYPISYEFEENGDYYDPFTGNLLDDTVEEGVCPDAGLDFNFHGIDVVTGERIFNRYRTIDSIFDYPLMDDFFEKNNILFSDREYDAFTNVELLKDVDFSLDDAKNEYLRLKAAGLSDNEINEKMMNSCKKDPKILIKE